MATACESGRFAISSLAVIGLALSQDASSAPWDFSGDVEVGVIYTDNLRLAPSGSEVDEMIYRVSPAIRATTEGDRLTANLAYSAEALFYDDTEDVDDIFHVLDASFTTAVVRNALFFYGSAINYQTFASADGGFPTTNVPLTSNRVDSRELEARPYWQQDLGFADVLVELSYVDTDFDEVSTDFGDDLTAQDNVLQRSSFSLHNHEQEQGIAWGLGYEYTRVEYEDAIPWDYQKASADLGFWVNGTMRIFGGGGLESSFDNIFDPALEDEFWEVGFQLRPNQRMDLEVAAGERTFGNSARVQLSYRHRRGNTFITYTERPSTRGGLGSGQRPLVGFGALDGLLNRPGDTDRFIQKRGEWQTSIELAKTSLTVRAFVEQREQRTSADGIPLEEEDLTGASIDWSWRLSNKSQVGLTLDYSTRETNSLDLELGTALASYVYQFTQRLGIVLAVQHSQEDNDLSREGGYVENQYQVLLRTSF